MPPPSTPLDSLWQPQAIAATVLAGEAVAFLLALSPASLEGFWVRFGVASLMVQWVGLATLLLIYLLRGRLATLPPVVVAWCCLGLLLAVTWLVAWFGPPLFGPWLADEAGRTAFVARAMAIALVVGLIALVVFQNHWEAKRQALRVKQAELEALQARVRPHFLFNTLNSVASLIHARPDEAEDVLLDLGDLFRAALASPGWVPLEEELDLCRRYLAIERKRFGERLDVEWRLPDDAAGLSVPLLSIQPLLENAVTHGLEAVSGVRTLRIEAADGPDALVVSVRNPLPDAAPARRRGGHGVGLSGVRARIDAATNGAGAVEIRKEDGSFEARMTLPKASMPAAPGRPQG